jgi:maltooligosyltrehalose trehalohydrolase
MAEIARVVRDAAAGRATFIVGENEPQDVRLVRPPERGGYGLDALWNDDFHHSAMVALTGHGEAYYTDYHGEPQEFISAVKWGYLYQGQRYSWQKKRRGTAALDLPPACFVTFIQNHDQVANSATGLRCHVLTSPGRLKAMTALLLLGPGTPMLFQGQEFAASAPFFFFADHEEKLGQRVADGRKKFLAQFRSIAGPGGVAHVPAPHDVRTFEQCKLDFSQRDTHRELYALHRDLLKLRRDDPAIRAAADAGDTRRARAVDGAVLGPNAFVLRFFTNDEQDRLLLVNLGRDLHLDPAPEPLLAPPAGKLWRTRWSSEDTRYGGGGTAPLDTEENWRIPGEAAIVLAPTAEEQP